MRQRRRYQALIPMAVAFGSLCAAAVQASAQQNSATGHDAANRATVKQYAPDAMNVVGLALREDKKSSNVQREK